MRNPSSIFVRFSVFSLAILLSIVGFTATAFAQGGVGTITGTVTDPKGLTVPQAKVVILNADTNTARPDIMTTDSGSYTATFLQPGQYQITISKDGFQTVVRKDLLLQVGQTLTVDVPLTVGTSVSEITVTGEAPLIEPDKSDFSQTVSETLGDALPLNGRRWEQFVLLTPGVTNDGTSGLVSYHGISGLFNNSTVDGVSNQQAFFSEDRGRTAVGYTYSLDAVKEFSVQSSSYSAEFGNAAGGQVNSVTKSGSNALHGDLFYFLRYPSFNALDPYAKTHGSTPINGTTCTGGTTLVTAFSPAQCVAPPSEHQRQQFGGSVGGPVVKDKLFYFVNYDGQRRSFPIIYTGPSTSSASNAVAGMVANNCTATVNGVAGIFIGTVATPISAAQCAAAVGIINTTIGPQNRLANQDVALGKLDYQVTPNNRLSASFNYMNFRSPNGYDQSATFNAGSIYQNGNFGTHDRFLVADWNSVISSNMVNDFRFQWSRDFQFYSANFSGPSVAVGNLFGYGLRNALPRPAFPDEHRLQFVDSASWVHNKHAVKFGVDISPVHELLINLFNGGGIYSYNYSDTSATTAAATLQAWIADLYGLPLSSDSSQNSATCYGEGTVDSCIGRHYANYQQTIDVVNPAALAGKDDFYDTHYGAYIQDAWKVTPTVTLNMGLRWDMQDIPQPAHPFTTDPLALFYTQKIYISKLNFQPRFGFAWQAGKNTVVRVGYGMFFGNTTDSLFYNTRVENGVVQKNYSCNLGYTPSTGVYNAPPNCLTALAGLPETTDPSFPNNLFSAPGPTLETLPLGVPSVTPVALNVSPSSLPASALNIRGQSPHFLEPMVNEGEIGVEHEFPGGVSASETFMLTKGQHLPTCPDVNLAPPGTPYMQGGSMVTPPTTLPYSTLALPSTGNGLFANGVGPTAPPAGISVTVPFYTSRLDTGVGIISACQSMIRSTYVAGITTVKKQFNHGFELLANYTLSKATDDGQVQGATGTFSGSSDAILDPYNIQGEQGYSDYDQRQRLIISTSYAPTFKVDNSVLGYLVNGFGFSGIITLASPMPVNGVMNTSTAPSITISGIKYTGIDGGVTGGESLNASTTAGRIPVVSKNFYRGKTQVRDIDLRITRDFKFTERMKLQVIAEAFNLFNHTNVNGVISTGYAYQTTLVNSSGLACASATSAACLVPQSSFLSPSSTSSILGGARQLQVSGKFFF